MSTHTAYLQAMITGRNPASWLQYNTVFRQQSSINGIGFCALQLELGKVMKALRIDDAHGQTCIMQGLGQVDVIHASGFHDNVFRLELSQLFGQQISPLGCLWIGQRLMKLALFQDNHINCFRTDINTNRYRHYAPLLTVILYNDCRLPDFVLVTSSSSSCEVSSELPDTLRAR